jgi:hypothetical protein
MRALAFCVLAWIALVAGSSKVLAEDIPAYVSAVVAGNNDRDGDALPMWAGRQVPFHITYIGSGSLDSQFPEIASVLGWIEPQFQDNSVLNLEIARASVVSMPDVDVANSTIELYVIDGASPVRLANLTVRHEEDADTVVDRGLFNCDLERWRKGSHIVKGVGVLHLTNDVPGNVKCVSMTLLFGLGLNVTGKDFAPPGPAGVMTSYLDEHQLLTCCVDMALLKLFYDGTLTPGEAKQDAIGRILRLKKWP